jgi:hypothetical protein
VFVLALVWTVAPVSAQYGEIPDTSRIPSSTATPSHFIPLLGKWSMRDPTITWHISSVQPDGRAALDEFTVNGTLQQVQAHASFDQRGALVLEITSRGWSRPWRMTLERSTRYDVLIGRYPTSFGEYDTKAYRE